MRDRRGGAARRSDGGGRAAVASGLFENGLACHEGGELAQAERLYRMALRQAPGDFGALYHLGLVCAQRGRLAEGAGLIRRALRRDPGSAAAHNDLGAVLKLLGRLDEAAASFEAALARAPMFAKARYNLGATLRALGRREPAAAQFREALALEPDLAGAHGDLGVTLAELGRFDAALPHCERAVALEPRDFKLLTNLGKVLQALDRPADALDCFEAALARGLPAGTPAPAELQARIGMLRLQLGRLDAACTALRAALAADPDFAELHCNLGVALLALARPAEAVDCFERALTLKPGMAEAYNDLGNALQALDRPDEAVARYRSALALRPDYVDAHNNLGVALAALGRHHEAVACYEAALAAAPRSVEAHNNLGTALAALGRETAALDCYAKALALDPTHAGAHANTGNALKALGQIDAARAALRRAIALDPRAPRFHRSLAECGPVGADDPLRAALAALARDADALPQAERIHLHFALAKAHDDAGETDAAFDQLCAGNALKRRTIDYDEAAILDGFARLRAVFTPALLRAHAGAGMPGAAPVFIVGMPRAGTTLVEQILASHPEVHGAGELDGFPEAVGALRPRDPSAARFPERLAAIDGAGWRALGAAYLAAAMPLAPAARRITDKLPLNFAHVGLIHLALPEARIVHVRRNPLDTCLSCFSKLFTGNQPFAYELGELGRYYRAYDTLMAHWRDLLPAGVMLELDYEAVVADLEPAARRLLAHCGLAWDDACLDFHKTPRPVRTASVVQVRQPLYRDAVGRAARYRHRLAPLIAALGGPLTV